MTSTDDAPLGATSNIANAAVANAIWGAGAAALCTVLVVTGIAVSRDETTTRALELEQGAEANDPGAPVTAPTERPLLVTPSGIASASAAPKATRPAGATAPPNQLGPGKSVAALRDVAKEFPNDPAVYLAIIEAHQAARAPATQESFADVQRLLELDPEAATKPAVIESLTATASLKPGAGDVKTIVDGALQILSTTSKAPGFDALIVLGGGSTPARQRAIELTKQESVQANASKAALVFVKLRDASPCGRAPFLEAAAADADKRALPLLLPMMAKKGCGFLSLSDCYSCMGTRAELTKAINAINARP